MVSFLTAITLTAVALQFLSHSVMAGVQPITYTGFLVDIYCWELPGHIGLDGANLELKPETHLLHCIADEAPCRSGLLLLEKFNDGGTEKYRDLYYLDGFGNQLGYQYYDKEFTGGDREISEKATVVGNLTVATRTIAVESLTFAPVEDNTILFIALGATAGGVLVIGAMFYLAAAYGYIGEKTEDAQGMEEGKEEVQEAEIVVKNERL